MVGYNTSGISTESIKISYIRKYIVNYCSRMVCYSSQLMNVTGRKECEITEFIKSFGMTVRFIL